MITVEDIAYVRYAVPDLDAALASMTDSGLHHSALTDSVIYMRVDVGPRPCRRISWRERPITE